MHPNQPLFIGDVLMLFELFIDLPSTYHPQRLVIQELMVCEFVSQLYLSYGYLRRVAVKVI